MLGESRGVNKKKKRGSVWPHSTVQCFINNCTIDAPMMEERLLNIREKQDGKLQRVNKKFYEFTTYMEVLWLMHLNSTVASVFKGDVFCVSLRRVIGTNKELRNRFHSCLPKELDSTKCKPLIDELYVMVINSYASMRASDTIRRVKQRKLKDRKTQETLTTRQYVCQTEVTAKRVGEAT